MSICSNFSFRIDQWKPTCDRSLSRYKIGIFSISFPLERCCISCKMDGWRSGIMTADWLVSNICHHCISGRSRQVAQLPWREMELFVSVFTVSRWGYFGLISTLPMKYLSVHSRFKCRFNYFRFRCANLSISSFYKLVLMWRHTSNSKYFPFFDFTINYISSPPRAEYSF